MTNTYDEKSETPWQNEVFDRFLQYCRTERGFSDETLRAYTGDLNKLGEYSWTVGRRVELDSMSETDLEQYVAWLRKQNLSESTIERHVAALRSFYKFLVKRDLREDNPSSELSFRDRGQSLPTVWSEKEIESFLNEVQETRDRALFELLYSTGMRVSEVVNLDWKHFLSSEETLRILGKGGKERIVPLGPTAKRWLEDYREIREDGPDKPVFVNNRGDRLTTRGVRYLVDKYHNQCSISRPLSPHVFRHSCATHMLNRGASLKTVQALLGHETLSTTQVYTHVSTDQLKEVYDKAHPRA